MANQPVLGFFLLRLQKNTDYRYECVSRKVRSSELGQGKVWIDKVWIEGFTTYNYLFLTSNLLGLASKTSFPEWYTKFMRVLTLICLPCGAI
jgi:hypothetical protein